MNPNDTPAAHPEVVIREEFDNWAVLFQPESGEAVGAGPVGVAIFRLLDGQRSLAQVAAEIEALCEDAPATALEDTLAFVQDLERRRFVRLKAEG